MVSEFKSFLKTVAGNEGGKCHYPTRLDDTDEGAFTIVPIATPKHCCISVTCEIPTLRLSPILPR